MSDKQRSNFGPSGHHEPLLSDLKAAKERIKENFSDE